MEGMNFYQCNKFFFGTSHLLALWEYSAGWGETKLDFIGENWSIWMDSGKNKIRVFENLEKNLKKQKIKILLTLKWYLTHSHQINEKKKKIKYWFGNPPDNFSHNLNKSKGNFEFTWRDFNSQYFIIFLQKCIHDYL